MRKISVSQLFFFIVVFLNVFILGLTLWAFLNDPTGFTFYGMLPLLLFIGAIDFIKVFSYINKKQSPGKPNIIGDIALIAIGSVIILAGVLVFATYGPELTSK